jgi:anti-sigma B factor antagonist
MPFTPQGFSVEVGAPQEGATVIRVRGELDMSTSSELASAVTSAGADADQVQLDLSGVTFLDSSAIGALVAVGGELAVNGSRLQIGPRSDIVSRVLEITGLAEPSDAFDVLPDPA